MKGSFVFGSRFHLDFGTFKIVSRVHFACAFRQVRIEELIYQHILVINKFVLLLQKVKIQFVMHFLWIESPEHRFNRVVKGNFGLTSLGPSHTHDVLFVLADLAS